jgi:hypothetical protein
VPAATLFCGAAVFAVCRYWGAWRDRLVLTGYDVYTLYVSCFAITRDAAIAGSLPQWDHRDYFGQPYAANVQVGALLPFNYLALLVPPPLAYMVAVALVQAFTCYFMTRLLQVGLNADPLSALAGGVAFAFSGYVMNKATLYNLFVSLPFLTAAVYFLVRFRRDGRARSLCGGAIAYGFLVVVGPPYLVYGSYLYGALLLAFFAADVRRDPRSALKRLAEGTVPLLIGAFLGSWQLAQTLRLTRFSRRSGGLSFQESAFASLPTSLLPATFLPDLGNAGTYGENVAHLPAVALLTCAVALLTGFASPERRDRRWTALGAALLLVGTTLALGGSIPPVHSLAFHTLPLVRYLRIPARWLLFSVFGVVALSTLAISAAPRLLRSRRAVAALAVAFVSVVMLTQVGRSRHAELVHSAIFGGVATVLLWLASWLPARLAPLAVALLALLLVGETYVVSTRGIVGLYAALVSSDAYRPSRLTPPEVLRADATNPRAFDAELDAVRPRLSAGAADYYQPGARLDGDIAGAMLAWMAGTNAHSRMSLLGGNFGDLGAIAGYRRALALFDDLRPFTQDWVNFLTVFHLKYAMFRAEALTAAGPTYTQWFDIVFRDDRVAVIALRHTLGRAFWLPALPADEGAPLTVALLAKYADARDARPLDVDLSRPNDIAIRSPDGRIPAGVVVLGQSPYPGWKAQPSVAAAVNPLHDALTYVRLDRDVSELALHFDADPALRWACFAAVLAVLCIAVVDPRLPWHAPNGRLP